MFVFIWFSVWQVLKPSWCGLSWKPFLSSKTALWVIYYMTADFIYRYLKLTLTKSIDISVDSCNVNNNPGVEYRCPNLISNVWLTRIGHGLKSYYFFYNQYESDAWARICLGWRVAVWEREEILCRLNHLEWHKMI